MRFIDASAFVHAYLKPKRKLRPHEREIKENAKEIVTRVNEGEEVVTTTVHLSEIANVLEDFLPLEEALNLESGILSMENVEILNVSKEDYLAAVPMALDFEIGLNDALASSLMGDEGITEIYSFDGDFDRAKNVKRIVE